MSLEPTEREPATAPRRVPRPGAFTGADPTDPEQPPVPGASRKAPEQAWLPQPSATDQAANGPRQRAGILTVREALAAGHTRREIRGRVERGEWQLHPGDVLVTQAGPLTVIQRLWCTLAAIGPDAVLGGASAAALAGLHGLEEHHLTVLLPAWRKRLVQRPGVRFRGTSRLDAPDLVWDDWPPRTALGRSLVDMAEWARGNEDARTVLAVAVACGLAETGEVREALARRGPIARRQVIADALDDLDRGMPWVAESLYRRIEGRHALPRARLDLPDPRRPGRVVARYEALQVRVELGLWATACIRTSSEPADPLEAMATIPAGHSRLSAMRTPWAMPLSTGWLVLRIPTRLLGEEPDRVGRAVGAALRQRGWAASARRRPARSQDAGWAGAGAGAEWPARREPRDWGMFGDPA